MKRILSLILTLACVALPTLFAQSVGDTEAEVHRKLGTPSMSRDTGERLIWMYDDGTKVVFVQGQVAEVNIPNNHPANYTTGQYVEPAHPERQSATRVSRERPRRSAEDEEISKPAAALLGIGGLVILVCQILFVIAAFSESVLWGLGVLFIPFVSLIFTFKNWAAVKTPVLVSLLVGLPMIVAGAIVQG